MQFLDNQFLFVKFNIKKKDIKIFFIFFHQFYIYNYNLLKIVLHYFIIFLLAIY